MSVEVRNPVANAENGKREKGKEKKERCENRETQ